MDQDPLGKQGKRVRLDAGLAAYKSVAVRDLWQHKDLGQLEGSYSTPIPSHGTVTITLK